MDYSGAFSWVPFRGNLNVNISQAIALVSVELKATTDGLLYPIIQDLRVDFGRSNVKTDGFVKQFLFTQTFNFMKYIVMDSINRFGKTLYNTLLPTIASTYSNKQYKMFNLGLKQLGMVKNFGLDYRLTADPSIHDGFIDLDFFFDIGPENAHCNMRHDEVKYDF